MINLFSRRMIQEDNKNELVNYTCIKKLNFKK